MKRITIGDYVRESGFGSFVEGRGLLGTRAAARRGRRRFSGLQEIVYGRTKCRCECDHGIKVVPLLLPVLVTGHVVLAQAGSIRKLNLRKAGTNTKLPKPRVQVLHMRTGQANVVQKKHPAPSKNKYADFHKRA